MTKTLFKNNKNKVRTINAECTEIIIKIGLQQGCILSSLLFSVVIDDAIKISKEEG